MAGIGITWENIALIKDMSLASLKRHCKTELKRGRVRANAQLLSKAHNMAMEGNTAMTIFLLKTRCGMRETNRKDEKNEVKKNESSLLANSLPLDPIEATKMYQEIMKENRK